MMPLLKAYHITSPIAVMVISTNVEQPIRALRVVSDLDALHPDWLLNAGDNGNIYGGA